MDALFRDFRHSLKRLRRDRTFTLTVLLTLALCVGANVVIFTVVHSVLLKPLPFEDPDRVVTLYNSYPGAGSARGSNGTVDFFERRAGVPAFEEVALYQLSGNTVGEAGSTERVRSLRVTPSLFGLLRVEARLGRTFTEDEMEVGNHRKVILTDSYWNEHFGGAPDVAGRTLRVDGVAYEIVGVLPASFQLPGQQDIRLVVPIAFDARARNIDNWHSNNFSMYARLAPGASIEQARAQSDALNSSLTDRWTAVPNARQLLEDVGFQTVIVPAHEDLVRDIAPTLYMLWAGVGFVLLIGCVNIANLMLARAHGRAGEVATQLALGAARARIGRQALTEAFVLAVVGSAFGILLGTLGLRAIRSAAVGALPGGAELTLSPTVLLFTMALAVGAALLFGLGPAIQLVRGDLSPVFRSDNRSGTASRGAVLLRNALVTGQVGLAFVLLIGAGLMLASFRQALHVDPGFDPEGVFTAFVPLPEARYPGATERRLFQEELRRQVSALPAVSGAALTSQLPFSGNNSNSVIAPEGYVAPPGESLLSPFQTNASPGYFEAMGIEVLEGRTFRDSDGPDAVNVIVLDEWLARRYFPDRSALGQRMVYGAPPGLDSVPESNLFTVVGVVASIKQYDLTAPESEFVGAYYFPTGQRPGAFMTVVARARTGDAEALTAPIRAVVRRLDAELPLFGIRSMEDRISESLARRRVPLVLLGVFAVVALFLAVVGIYGSLAYSVSQRTREIGLRMALGSAPDAVFRTVVGQGLRMIGGGLVLGAMASWFLSRLIQALLFGVAPTDPAVMLVVALVLAGAGTLACVLPARRATRVDPMVALGG